MQGKNLQINISKLENKSFHLESFHLYHKTDLLEFNGYTLSIILCESSRSKENKKIKINFYEAREFSFGDFNVITPLKITVEDISNYQIEEINYYVKEASGLFSLSCKNIDYNLINETSK